MGGNYIKDLAKKVIQAAKAQPYKPPTRSPADRETETLSDDDMSSSGEDALDRKAFKKGGFGKAEKRAYAKQKFEEELLTPPKNPPPAWLSDPALLPKKPPRAE